jgi:hypothetical protein
VNLADGASVPSIAVQLADSGLIGVREGLETGIVVMILVAFLVKSERRESLKWVAVGVTAAVAMVTVIFLGIHFGTSTVSGVTAELIAGIAIPDRGRHRHVDGALDADRGPKHFRRTTGRHAFNVTGAAAPTSDAGPLIEAASGYRRYLISQVDALRDATAPFVAAVNGWRRPRRAASGRRGANVLRTGPYYERVEPVAECFPSDLDPRLVGHGTTRLFSGMIPVR